MSALIAIIFDSGSGHTAALAASIAAGATSENARIITIALAEGPCDFRALENADALVFGAPTYMGGVSARFKEFMDASSDIWLDQPWHNKIAGGFTIGTNRSGDKLATLQHLAIFAAQHGMIWVGQDIIGGRFDDAPTPRNPDGSWLGLMATSGTDKAKLIEAGDKITAEQFGKRIARAAHRWGTGRQE